MNKIEWYEAVNQKISEDLDGYYSKFYNADLRSNGSGYTINPCPNCTHNDACTISTEFAHCFSCNWSGNHISALTDYTAKGGEEKKKTINKIAEYIGIPYPSNDRPENQALEERKDRFNDIKMIAIFFYHNSLVESKTEYLHLGKKYSPLRYQELVRKHSLQTMRDFRVGFSENGNALKLVLRSSGYTEDEIRDAEVWVPEGLFVYPQFHPVTGELIRFNTKNPFAVTRMNPKTELQEIIAGFSSGIKTFGFAPGFSWKKATILLEGENDAQTVWEELSDESRKKYNVAWMAGNIDDELFKFLRLIKAPIYLFMDNDAAGNKYIDRVNSILPEKDLRKIIYDETIGDPDEYYKKFKSHEDIEVLILNAHKLETEDFSIRRVDAKLWVIENRYKRIEFRISKLEKGIIIGDGKLYEGDKLKDTEQKKQLTRMRSSFKPMCLSLDDEMQKYHNMDIEKKSFEELLEIFNLSTEKVTIIKELARILHTSSERSYESMVVKMRGVIGSNSSDSVLKEINDLQNRGIAETMGVYPSIKLSHYFNVINNDAYAYFTYMKFDGEAVRKLPFLLRNDGMMIRLDLMKRKDDQCLLLVDNKYELPDEVLHAKIDLQECSLIQSFAEDFSEGRIADEDISPYALVKKVEMYLRKFIYHKDPNVYKVIALYIYGTYFYEMFGQYPYLFINGEKGTGKTILDTVIHMFGLNAKFALDISEAALYRMISLEGGVIILDEMENLTSRSKSQDSLMATLLKGGYQRGGKAYRFNTDTNCSEGFDVFGPKIISNIFGLEDVIEDRCIRIDTCKFVKVDGREFEDPKVYVAERLGEIREVTSRMSLSSLKHFQILNHIYTNSTMATGNARLTQLLTPILALAKMVDLSKDNPSLQNVSDEDIAAVDGEFLKSFIKYYDSTIVFVKRDIENGTTEGIIKDIVRGVAIELSGKVVDANLEYTNKEEHKYKNEIKFNKDTGMFTLDALHMKCFIEESTHELMTTAKVRGYMKSVFSITDPSRRMVDLTGSDEELIKEFKGTRKPKVYHYEFFLADVMPSAAKDIFLGKSEKIVNPTSTLPF